MSKCDKAALLAEIVELTRVPEPEPDEFTIREFMEASEQTANYESARRRLERLIKQGVLQSRLVVVNGRTCRVYKKTV